MRYCTMLGRLFRTSDDAEDRFDRDSGKWVNVVPFVSDLEYSLDTLLEDISEEIARGMEPTAFTE